VLRGCIALEDSAVLRQREAEGRWSPLGILAHLEEEERRESRMCARIAGKGKAFESGMAVDPPGWITAHRYNEMGPREVPEALQRGRLIPPPLQFDRRAGCRTCQKPR
jgi:hypothetical protein